VKILIEGSAKLYSEFWGSLSTNYNFNLNIKKLFAVGYKLNNVLIELNELWESELKNKKIGLEHQNIVQLYAYFQKEILKNKIKAEDILKKLNDDKLFEHREDDNGDNIDLENLDSLLEKEEYSIIARTNDVIIIIFLLYYFTI